MDAKSNSNKADARQATWGATDTTPSLEDVLVDADAVKKYQSEMDFFVQILIKLNVNIFVVERIFEFPYKLFLGNIPERTIFFGQVIDNFLEGSVLLITNLVVDQGDDIHSLRAFQNWLMQVTKPEAKRDLQNRLREVRFRQIGNELLQPLKQLRTMRIAHLLNDFASEVSEARAPAVRVDFAELKALRDELNLLFNALSFHTEYILLPLGYDLGNSDIEAFLDAVARTSDILNMPKQAPEFWPARRSALTEQEMAQLNSYRRKFSLPEV